MSKQLQLTAQQHTALSLIELSMHTLVGAQQACTGLGATTLSMGVAQAIKTIQKAHEDFLAETQRSITIAAPADVAKLVTP